MTETHIAAMHRSEERRSLRRGVVHVQDLLTPSALVADIVHTATLTANLAFLGGASPPQPQPQSCPHAYKNVVRENGLLSGENKTNSFV